MNYIASILGSMPASTSDKGEINGIDWKKILRMAVVGFGGYCLVAITEAAIRDLTNGAFGIPAEFTTPIVGALSLFLEAVRRKMVAPAK